MISARTNLKISFFRQESVLAWGVKLCHRTFPGRTETVPSGRDSIISNLGRPSERGPSESLYSPDLAALACACGARFHSEIASIIRAQEEEMLIVVEGCVGAGKSTVAKGLAAFRESTLLLEDFESNPFLRDFYDDPVGNATETEFAFLLLHFHQLKSQAGTALRSEVDRRLPPR